MDERNGILFSHVLNFYDVVLLLTAALALLLIFPLLSKRDRQKSDYLLAAFIFCQGATAFYNLMMYNFSLGPVTVKSLYPWHFVPFTLIYAVQGFLLLRYSQAMMGKLNGLLSKRSVFWGIIILFVSMGDALLRVNKEVVLYKQVPGIAWIVLLSLSLYLGARALSQLRIYELSIRQHYSNIDDMRLHWLWLYTLGFVAVWGMMICSFVLALSGAKQLGVDIGTFANALPMLLMSGLVIHGQQAPLNTPVPINAGPTVKKETLTKNEPNPNTSAYREKLEDLMLRVKIYQDPDLRLDDLADSMGLSPRTVSSLLNGYYQKNFYDFINYYRVMDSQQQLSDASNNKKTVQRIFEDAGFNSKSTFNTLFKKTTGTTPSEYRKESQTGQSKIH